MNILFKNNYKWRGLFSLLIGTLSVLLSLSFLFPASPIIMKDFNATLESVSWLTLSYAISASAFAPVLGKAGDIFGRKKNVLIGMAIFTIAQMIAALSPNLFIMSIARFIQGFGAAAVMPVGMAFISEHFPDKERGKALGIWGMTMSIGPAIGPILSGHLINWFGWRAIFWFSALLGLLSFAIIQCTVKESLKQLGQKIDFIGSILLFLSSGSLIVYLNKGNNWGWTSIATLTVLSLFIISVVIFYFFEKRTAHPIVDIEYVKSPAFIFPSLTAFTAFVIFQGSFFVIPFFLQHIQHYLPSETGLIIFPLSISLMISSLLVGKLIDSISIRIISALGMLIALLALIFFSRLPIEASFFKISLILSILGLGIGSSFPAMSKAITNSCPLPKIGSSVGTFNMIRNLGGPFGIAISANLFSHKMAFYVSSTSNGDIIIRNADKPFFEVGIFLLVAALISVISALFISDSIKIRALSSEKA